jgi:GNAT superfamily N-acetyltransferase
LRPVLDAVLEGKIGRLVVAPSGRAARADAGCYSFFGGEADDPGAMALLEDVTAPVELVFRDSGRWTERARDRFGPRLSPRPMRWFHPFALENARLGSFVSPLPAGYEIERMDERHAQQLGPALEPHALQTHDSVLHFLGTGFGFAVVRTGVVVSAATSYAASAGAVEVAIATHPDHRGRGLARAAAARMCLDALERRLEPHWNASNPVSQRLAVHLGFTPDRIVPIEYLHPES